MNKKTLFFSLTAMLLSGLSYGQKHCYTDEVRKEILAAHPEILVREADLNKQINEALKHIDYSKLEKKTTTDQTGNEDFWYEIPIVVHIVHDYGAEYITDNSIFDAVKQWNIVYAKQNADTATVIAPFKKYIGNAHIRLHLATKDPMGNPTHGITRHRSYMATNGGDKAKLDDWSPSSYMNIWFINKFSGAHTGAAAYAYQPPTADAIPYYDGVISLYDYIVNDNTINHEIGHCFYLDHPWGNNNSAGAGACSDGGTDNVDDTPPTLGHNVTGCTAAALYDTTCAHNYFKIYPNVAGLDSLVNYPDTTNSENIMDYTYCSKMFTRGQVNRMHAALNSTVAGRNHLWNDTNLLYTGALAARPDLKPIPEFNCTYLAGSAPRLQMFTCPGTSLRFTNKTWNDTVSSLVWSFSNGASTPSTTISNPSFSSFVNNSFTDGGWVNITMKATGNNSGDTTVVFDKSVFVADPVATPAANIVEEFNPAENLAKWPMFNYYNNEFKWEASNVGFYDNHSIKYNGYDSRVNPTLGIYPPTGMPKGDYDDFFSVPVDLTSMASGNCNLNFFTSGASRSSNSLDISDTMIISYSVDKAKTWTTLKVLAKSDLLNKGAISTPYVPTTTTDWVGRTISIPAAARQNYVVFRFRYFPGDDHNGYEISTGNNFYMDRLSFSPYAAGVNDVTIGNLDAIVVPNPTNGNAYVVVKDAGNTTAEVTVSDIAGKVIYKVSQPIVGSEARIEIPQSYIQVQGIYMVQTTTGGLTKTQKLVVY